MKILKISGQNLASLAGRFCVDFEQEPLASSGLFAISGPTGSGKSTLLDALCLALYDATPRLFKVARGAALVPDVGSETISAQDPRNLLRRGAGEAWAEVDFVGNDGVRYRARWSVRRSRGKSAGSLQKSVMTLHRLPELSALGGTKTEVAHEIAQRVGLSFEQFTRAVLLAQNEFSAFLKTEENERGELLETLTGSVIYSAISRRAFERFKLEQAALTQLGARLADHTPLAPDARQEIEAASAVADAALAAIDQRRAELEQRLRWRQQADLLGTQKKLAEQAVDTAAIALADAQPQRRHLATLDALEPARQLQLDGARLEHERVQLKQAQAKGAEALDAALALQADSGAALAAALGTLHQAEQAQQAYAPQLDQAKALDASIAALEPSHRKAADLRSASARAQTLADAALGAVAERQRSRTDAHQQASNWLARHSGWAVMAQQWPRWDTLFAQAAQASAQERTLAGALEQACVALQLAGTAEADASAAFAGAGLQLQAQQATLQQAGLALAQFDGEQLRAARQALEQRRDSLNGAEKIWNELASGRERLQQAATQGAQLQSEKAAAELALAAAQGAAPAIEAGQAQAERSLKAAELACADSVVDLRATLADGAPCPVCGSAEHPYQHQHSGAGLLAMLASLRGELERCRLLGADNLSAQAGARAVLAASSQQLASIANQGEALETALVSLNAAWLAHALAGEAPAEAVRHGWFASQIEALRHASRQLDAQEQAAHQTAQARDAAQHTCDALAAEHARHQLRLVAERSALAQAAATQAGLLERRAQAGASVAALLAELDKAFVGHTDWHADWQGAPQQYRAARAAEVEQALARSAEQAACASALAALQIEHGAATTAAQQTGLAATAAAQEFALIDADIATKRAARASIGDGKPVHQIEHELAQPIAAARIAVADCQGAAGRAAQAETRAREALVQHGARLATLQAQAQAAVQKLDAWIARYAEQHARLEPVADAAQLALLLGRDPDSVARERGALQELDVQAARAATVLAERRAQLDSHLSSNASADSAPAAELAELLAALLAGRQQADDEAGALRLQLAQDQARRSQAQSMLAEIDKQQLVERRWGRMNELIGSSDGKKFRNYAQQFTLDVLLGYANGHLGQLARRYRLERVINPAGPSLGLMVRDQDMGGEVRSVNSLSGGESFLVSLALALGLASLSSNRVRVESLFIDEGFGSLDSETLRVAMDALDGLQSLGRKVGVISHVQEMTERIATRVLVQPAGAGTSCITVQ